MKKFIIALATVIVLCVPAFATDYSSYFVTGYTCTGGTSWNNFTVSTSDDVYFARINQQSSTPSSTRIYALTVTSGSKFLVNGRISGDVINRTYTLDSSPVNGVYYSDFSGTGSIPNNCTYNPDFTPFPYGTTNSQLVDAFSEFLASSGGGDSVSSSFTVPAGNVLYFKVATEQDISLVASMPVLSNIIGSPWTSGVQFGEAAALPTSFTTFPILSQSDVTFTKSNSDRNILGQTKTGIATKHCIVGQYYALYCPFHYGDYIAYGTGSSNYQSGNAGIIGASVNVSGSLTDIRVYPLSQRVSENVLGDVSLISGSDDDYTSYYDGTVDSNGVVTWLDQNGDVGAPSVGGQNYVPDDVSTESVVQQIKNILNNIISEIKSLFSFGYEAVNSLVGIMRDFVSSFAQLYTWLPAPVYSALISAVTIAIVIGVFKVFL